MRGILSHEFVLHKTWEEKVCLCLKCFHVDVVIEYLFHFE